MALLLATRATHHVNIGHPTSGASERFESLSDASPASVRANARLI